MMLSSIWFLLLGFVALVQGRSSTNSISTIAGTGSSTSSETGGITYSGENVAPTSAVIYLASDIFTDSSNGDFYMSAYSGYRVFILGSTTGLVTTLVGTGTGATSSDGGNPDDSVC